MRGYRSGEIEWVGEKKLTSSPLAGRISGLDFANSFSSSA